jgi:hypothetical protein
MMLHKLIGKKEKSNQSSSTKEVLEADQMLSISSEEERIEDEVLPVPVPLPDPTILSRVEEGAGQDEEVEEFELWVETDLDAGWCLDTDNVNQDGKADWRSGCSTSTITRRWCEFEELAKMVDLQDFQHSEGLEELGLSKDAEISTSNVDAAFRRLARERHPDKGGSMESFQALVNARHAAQRACTAA